MYGQLCLSGGALLFQAIIIDKSLECGEAGRLDCS